MKKHNINKFLLGAAVVAMGGLSSCEDFLTITPTNSITKEDYWNTRSDVDNVRAAAYYQMTQLEDKILIWGEFRSDNVTLNKMDQTAYLRLKEAVLQPTQGMFDWSGFYKGINYCNEVLENGQRMIDNQIDPSFTEGDWLPIKAEMISLRALYYFYLVRAYRDVPYVTASVSSDTEAKASRIAATPGYQILDECIAQVEEAQKYAAKNFGAGVTSTGRFTVYSMAALLADMYLWRACLYNNIADKKDASGNPYTPENASDGIVTASLQKCIDNCDFVINRMKSEYTRKLDLQNVTENDPRRKQPFPLYTNTSSRFGSTTDMPYYYNFGQGNSDESVFELQYDGVNVSNSTYGNLFYGDGDGSFAPRVMTATPILFSRMAETDPDMGLARGYGLTDFRAFSTAMYEKESQNVFPIIKNIVSDVQIVAAEDVRKGADYFSYRSNKSSSASCPIYRLSDVMLLKSEAIARLLSKGGTASRSMGFHLINNLFARNNPEADSLPTETNNPTYCARLAPGWASTRSEESTDTLLRLTYYERQREFIAEGKRWFDLVRECEWRNETEEVLEWMAASSSVKNRCRNLWSLYNPIYADEMKVNGVGYGDGNGKLVQNPVWQKYMQD